MHHPVPASRGIGGEDAANFIAHPAEDRQLILLRAGCSSGILKCPVVTVHLSGEDRALPLGIAADGDDGFDWLAAKFIEVFGTVLAGIQPDFRKHSDCQRVHQSSRFASSTGDPDGIAGRLTQDRLGQVGATRIARAENQYERWQHPVS